MNTDPTPLDIEAICARHDGCAPHVKERQTWKDMDDVLVELRDLRQAVAEWDAKLKRIGELASKTQILSSGRQVRDVVQEILKLSGRE